MISPYGDNGNKADFKKELSASEWMVDIRKDLLRFKHIQSIQALDQGGPDFSTKKGIVTIDIFAEHNQRTWLFANEIEDILFDKQVNTANRILKSDGLTSAITTFDRSTIDWKEISAFEDAGIVHQLSGEIGCNYLKNRT